MEQEDEDPQQSKEWEKEKEGRRDAEEGEKDR
jgi:hypothetical protein